MPSFKQPTRIIKELDYWLKLATFIQEPLRLSLLFVLHNKGNLNYVGLPSDPEELYNYFKTRKAAIYQKKSILNQKQISLLLPKNENKVYSDQFDCTLISFVIQTFVKLPTPSTGWNYKDLANHDQSISANFIRARELRNYVFHHNCPKTIDEVEFNKKWDEGVDIITNIGLQYDLEDLKVDVNISNAEAIIQYCETFTDSRLTAISKESKEMIGSLKAKIEKLKQEKPIPASNDYVVQETINVICQEIGGKWKDVARRIMGTNQEIIEEIGNNPELTDGDKLRRCFEIVDGKIAWHDLKNCLTFLNLKNIIKKAQETTLLTIGRTNAHNELKRIYKDELENWLRDHPFFETGECDGEFPTGNSAYVELAIIDAKEMDKIWNNDEATIHLQLNHFDRSKIPVDNIVTKKDKFVVLRGIAGIGKSTLVQSYVQRWTNPETKYAEDEATIHFFFKFNCRDLNTLDEIGDVNDLLKKKFPSVFRYISIDDLYETPSSVLILIDGIDELRSIHNINNSQSWPEGDKKILKCVIELMDIPLVKTIVSGRPEACRRIVKNRDKKIKMIEICGFNSNSVKQYIDNVFRDKKETAANVLAKVQETDYLRAMASIPIYLWVICGMYNEKIELKLVRNTTELCCYACLLFIQRHLKQTEKNYSDMNLDKLCEDQYVLEIVTSLARLSKHTYENKKVVFQAKDSPQNVSVLENTGFIVKRETNVRGTFYQFRHLVLQEFLSALQFFLDNKSIEDNPELEACFPIISGLWGILHRKEDQLLITFIDKLQRQKKSTWFYDLPVFHRSKLNIQNTLEKKIEKKLFKNTDEIEITGSSSNLLKAIFEYHGGFSDKILKACKQRKLFIKNLIYHHDISNTAYFVEKFQIKGIYNIMVTNVNNIKLPENFKILIVQHFKNDEKRKRICILRGGAPMRIGTDDLYRGIETTLKITLDPKDTKNTHENLLQMIVEVAGIIEVRTTFSSVHTEMLERCIENITSDNDKPTVKHTDN